MTAGLPVSRLIRTSVVLAPLAAQFANLKSLLILGDSNVIDVSERIRSYASLSDIASDYGTSAPEYLAAQLYFSQNPQPTQVFLGRWAQSATQGLIRGGILTATEQGLGNFTAVTSGGFKMTIDGTLRTFTAINLSTATNLNGVAALVDTAITAYATCVWTGSRFVITSKSSGTSSTVSAATAPGSGTDIGPLLKMTAALAAPVVNGIAAESALTAVTVIDNMPRAFYGLMLATTAALINTDHLAIAAYVQGATRKHIYGVTITNTNVLDSTVTNDLASSLKAANYTRTFCQYSDHAYAIASAFGRGLTTDFAANNSTITLMYKQEPGIVPQNLTDTQADTLKSKRCNVFVNYDNNTAILQYGMMSGQAYFDEVHGLDWLSDDVQTSLYNRLYLSTTKVPQTDAGVHELLTIIEASCIRGVNNGLIAPGQWNSGGFGKLKQGDFLKTGFYVYVMPISQQAQPDREARKAPPFQIAVKLGGAIHEADAVITVNR